MPPGLRWGLQKCSAKDLIRSAWVRAWEVLLSLKTYSMKLFNSSNILSSQILFTASLVFLGTFSSCPNLLLAMFACLRVGVVFGVLNIFLGSIPKRESVLLLRVSAVLGVEVEVALVVG